MKSLIYLLDRAYVICAKNNLKNYISFAPHLNIYFFNLRQMKLNKKALSNMYNRVPTKIVIFATYIIIINKMYISKINSMCIK